MKIGTKSLFFGVHQFLIHPLTVLLAWIELYGIPSFPEFFCILIHDIGYLGASDIDGQEGEKHPELAARIVKKLFGDEYRDMCLYHSRHYAELHNTKVSKLCYADKLSIKYDPKWFYLFRAWLSGELTLYRRYSAQHNNFSLERTNTEWFMFLRNLFIKVGSSPKESIV